MGFESSFVSGNFSQIPYYYCSFFNDESIHQHITTLIFHHIITLEPCNHIHSSIRCSHTLCYLSA